jgi:hypothetical protein
MRIKLLLVSEEFVPLELNNLFFLVDIKFDSMTSVIVLVFQCLCFLIFKTIYLVFQRAEVGENTLDMRCLLILLFVHSLLLLCLELLVYLFE